MRIRNLALPLFFLALALVMTWPLAADLGGTLGGGLDPLLQSWILAWDAHALRTNPLGVWQAPIFFPYPDTLAYTDHHLVLTLLAAPIVWLTGNPAVAHNLLVILSYAFSGYAVYLLACEMWSSEVPPDTQAGQPRGGNPTRQSLRQVARRAFEYISHPRISVPAAACIAGVACAFSAFRMAQFVHLQLLQTAWLALALLYLLRAVRSTRWQDGVLCGLFFAIQCVTALYYAYFAAVALGMYMGLWICLRAWQRVRQHTRLPWDVVLRLAVGVLLAAAMIIPLMLPYLRVYQSVGVVRSPRELENWSAPLQAYLAVDPGNWLLGRFTLLQASGGEFALFPGLVVSVLACVGVVAQGLAQWRVRRSLAAAQGEVTQSGLAGLSAAQLAPSTILLPFLLGLGVLAFVLSLGTVLRVVRGGDVLPVPLPYGLLYERLPGFGALRVPARWGMLVSLVACLLAARGLLAFRSVRGLLPIGALILILAESATSLPLTRAPDLATAPAVYSWLGDAAQDDVRAVLELPAGRTQRGAELEKTMRRQYYGTLHWRRMVTGYSGLIPFGTTDLLGRAQQLPDAEAIQLLQLAGIDTLVIHRDEYAPDAFQKLRSGLDASPIMRQRADLGEAIVYTLAPFAGIDLPRGATVVLTGDERAPGVAAMALAQHWAQGGAQLYGPARVRYYSALAQARAGQVFDYGLLADSEDPQLYGFSPDRQLWHAAGLALYARDPQLVVNLELGVVPAGAFHPAYPTRLDLTLSATEAQIAGQRMSWTQPITSAVIELDLASLTAQQIETAAGRLAIPAGVTQLSLLAPLGQQLQIIGQPAVTAIVRVRVRAAGAHAVRPLADRLALAAAARFEGSRLHVDARAAGSGALLIEARGAAAADDHPIMLLSGIQPIAPDGHAAWSFSTDLLAPDEPWLQQKSSAIDGRYIVYVKDASHAAAPGTPIAQFRVRGGQVVDAQPVPLPLMALP